MTTWEVGVKGAEVVLILSVHDDDARAVAAAGVSMCPDDARALVNALGHAIKDVARMVMT